LRQDVMAAVVAIAGSTMFAQQAAAPASAAPAQAAAPAAGAAPRPGGVTPADPAGPPLPGFKVFQFPADQIPRIDGKDDDWAMVPESYVITLNDMHDDEHKHDKPDPKDLDIRVKVGWVKGLNRLYFLYEAYDNYWDFADPGLHNDTFELVVDGDRSGGALIPQFRNNTDQSEMDAHFSMHGVQAQNYHIMTPARARTGRWSGAASRGSRRCRGPITRRATASGRANRALHSGVLHHAVRLCGVRGAAAGGGVGAVREQGDRALVGGD
jgi:hypothetical protein